MAAVMLPSVDKLRGREKYTDWAFAVKTFLQHEDLWSCVAGTDTTTDQAVKEKRDIKAKAKIIMTLDCSLFVHVRTCKTSKEVWENLMSAFEDSGLTRKVSLMRKLVLTKLDECSSIDVYISTVMDTAQKLSSMRLEINEEWLGAFLLAGLPEAYKPMTMGIENSGAKVTADYVKTKLLSEGKVTSNDDSAFISHQKKTAKKEKSKVRCFNCNKFGHFANECKKPKRKVNKSENAQVALFTGENVKSNDNWFLDSGTSSHMTSDLDALSDVKTVTPPKSVFLADGRKISVNKIGNYQVNKLQKENLRQVKITNVLYVPELSANLISVSQLIKGGKEVIFDGNKCKIMDSKNSFIVEAILDNGLYKLALGTNEKVYSVTSSSQLWHRRLGHLNTQYMKNLEKITKVKISDNDIENKCSVCIQGKQSKLPFHKSSSFSSDILELIHTDVCGPLEVDSLGGAKYFLTLLDDYSHYVTVFFLKYKSDVKKYLMEYVNRVENFHNKRKIIRSDNGTEYMNKDIENFLKQKGITHQTSVAYNPQQNGKAERLNRTIIEKNINIINRVKIHLLHL